MIALEGVTVRQGGFNISDISLAIGEGQYAVLMGRTGSGKTTLLEVIAGLRAANGGRVILNGVDVTAFAPAARQLGYVPQDRALFRSMTVAQHLAFGPELRGWDRSAISARVNEVAARLGITALLPRYPRGLSGGEAARIALGRALSFRPRVLLLDEPLNGLDEDTRDEVMGWLRDLRDERVFTVLHITHSRTEARYLADVRFELRNGQVVNVSDDR